jgi:hypothetical protein
LRYLHYLLIDLRHQQRQAADVSHSMSVTPDYPGLF